MVMKTVLPVTVVMFVLSAAVFAAQSVAAQTAAELERVLALPAVSYGDAAWFILGAAGAVPPGSSAADTWRFAADSNWLPKKAAAETPAALGGLSFLIMKALNIRGGLMYAMLSGPRYAYRELVYRKIISGRAYSSMPVSGERLLRILSRALEYSGDTSALPSAPPSAPPSALPAALPAETEGQAPDGSAGIARPGEGSGGNE